MKSLAPALLALALAGCAPKADLAPVKLPDPVAMPALAAGVHRGTLQAPSGKTLKYVLSIPEFPAGQKVPLAVTLHYGGKEADYYGEEMVKDFTGPALKPLNAVVVGPDCLTGDDWDKPVNAEHVALLVKSLTKAYPIDDKKVLLTGFSAGGIGTWAIARQTGTLFSAAIPVAGNPQGADDGWTLPVYAIHSEADTILPIGPTKKAVEGLKAKGVNAVFKPLQGITHYKTMDHARALPEAVAWLRGVWAMPAGAK